MNAAAGVAALALVAAALAGCAMPALAPPQASISNIQAIRSANLAPLNVGSFTPAPGKPAEMDKTVSVRAGYVNAPGGSFAKYLGDTLAEELKASGRLDPNATLVVSGVVTETHLESEPTPGAALGAKFTLMRAGQVAFEKTLRVEAKWDWDYFGDVAIPEAINNYAGLFWKLITALLADPDFQSAARAR